jgi:hypothetical protein
MGAGILIASFLFSLVLDRYPYNHTS